MIGIDWWLKPVLALLCVVSSFAQISCAKEETYAEDIGYNIDQPYVFKVPKYFPEPIEMPSNPMTQAGVELGRHLFYEPLLSGNKKVSCATCHHPDKAFSDGLVLSNTGISGRPLERHSPAIFNLVWTDSGFFWDGGSTNLESQAFAPLTHPDEMGIHFPEMTVRLASIPQYVDMFQWAFKESPTAVGVAKALAQFQRSVVSADAPYDRYRRGENPLALGHSALRGLRLVQQKCGSCHSGELFTDNRYHNNGLDSSFTDDSHEEVYFGRYRISRNPADMGAFKTPSLRNVMVSAPYMHDGRLTSIVEVFEHYRSGVQPGTYTDRRLYQANGRPGIALTDEEVRDMIAFLHSLTDNIFLNNPQYANPYKTQ
ncbi:c-type cytochrome [Sphingobacterium sp. lm-10]|uniref:cytochrome-c peroxidase n=1 Tax=Sphingobacterium sp. lm-10 TaxID=2944904 RepID=UPI0020227DD5|nr:cytochrome c peroxidase [Sphingobacterium sp. lm-10]MCL7989076.1 c-type cytochrome [Sphingobacterium sp. lm-10]